MRKRVSCWPAVTRSGVLDRAALWRIERLFARPGATWTLTTPTCPDADWSVRPWGRRGGAEAKVLLVDGGADRRQRLALAFHAHHVTRDVHAQGSGRGVAREGDEAVRFGLHVAGPIRRMAEAGAAARARHPAERVGVGGGEGVEASGVALGGEER